jgi:hypothetical protein
MFDVNEARECLNEAADAEKMSTGQIAGLFNAMAKMTGDTPVKRFSDKTAALRRLKEISTKLLKMVDEAPKAKKAKPTPAAAPAPEATEEESEAGPKKVNGALAAKVKAAAKKRDERKEEEKAAKEAKAKEKAERGKPGRASNFGGMFLYPKVEANPRRAGSFGAISLGIIISNPGISFDDFIKKGGRAKDLAWDIKAGHARVSKVQA